MDHSEKAVQELTSHQESGSNGNISANGSHAIAPRLRRLHDPKVSFQEYQHYASLTREEQENAPAPKVGKNILAYLIPNLQRETGPMEASHAPDVNTSDPDKRKSISDEEWLNASRALRTATAGAV